MGCGGRVNAKSLTHLLTYMEFWLNPIAYTLVSSKVGLSRMKSSTALDKGERAWRVRSREHGGESGCTIETRRAGGGRTRHMFAGEPPGQLKLGESELDMRATLMYAWSRESSCAQGVGLAWLMTPLFGNSSPNPPAPSLSVEPMPITAYPAQRW